jgi:hypothetical protein
VEQKYTPPCHFNKTSFRLLPKKWVLAQAKSVGKKQKAKVSHHHKNQTVLLRQSTFAPQK